MKKSGKTKSKYEEKSSTEEERMKHYLGALNEMHGETLKGIRENSVITNKKLDDIIKTLDEHTETLGEHTKILGEHTRILGEHTRILANHTEMIGILMEDTSALKDDMQIVKKELKKKVDYDEFLLLVQRVNKLEAKS